MRFCGMCGTPLPHRPITAPGAHSTLSLTRSPVDARAAREQSTASQEGGGVALDPGPAPTAVPDAPPLEASTSQGNTPAMEAVGPPVTELVPDVPLDEYVRKFRYEPPREAAEVTMRGDEPVASPPQQQVVEPAANLPQSPMRTPPLPSAAAPDVEDVDSRLGLQPETPAEERIARPRFLEINQPANPGSKDDQSREVVPGDRVPTIGGPSFLGLDEGPRDWADAVGVERGNYAPRRSHWRLWSALVLVLLLIYLGVLERRAQVQQTNNGPVEVVRTKVRDWRKAALSQIDNQLAPPANDNSKPDIQVQPQQPAPQASKPSPETKPPDVNAQQAPPEQPQAADKTAPAGDKTESETDVPAASNVAPPTASPATPKVTSGNSAQPAAAEKRQPTSSTGKAAQPAAAKPAVLGTEEMVKAENASDPAAAAAWLWKATAKGNPDAPVQLANMYIQGNGVPRSCEQALVLLKTAAAKENSMARNRLGSMYASGTCVPPSRVEAYRWYSSSLAANPNSQWTQQTRNVIWQEMTPEERTLAQKYR